MAETRKMTLGIQDVAASARAFELARAAGAADTLALQ